MSRQCRDCIKKTWWQEDEGGYPACKAIVNPDNQEPEPIACLDACPLGHWRRVGDSIVRNGQMTLGMEAVK